MSACPICNKVFKFTLKCFDAKNSLCDEIQCPLPVQYIAMFTYLVVCAILFELTVEEWSYVSSNVIVFAGLKVKLRQTTSTLPF